MKRAAELIYLYFGFFLFGLAMFMVFPVVAFSQLFLPKTANEWVKLHCMKIWAASFYTFGIWFYHKGSRTAQKEWPDGPLIIVANHNSLLDTPAIYLMLKRFAKPLAKIELTKAPIFGHLCSWITLPVDRKSTQSRQSAMDEMKSYLSQGGSLVIFPEGRTNKSQTPIQPFESGAFRLSYELGVPVAPVLVRGSKYCLAATNPMTLRPGIVSTKVGPLFHPEAYSSAIDLQRGVFEWYQSQLLIYAPA